MLCLLVAVGSAFYMDTTSEAPLRIRLCATAVIIDSCLCVLDS